MSSGARPPVLEVRDLVVAYGEFGAVNQLNLVVEQGLTTALVGPSGCGKTTLLRAIAGFEHPVSGSIRLDGEIVSAAGRWVDPERRQVGMVFQEGALFPHLSVGENVRYGVRGRPEADQLAAAALRLVGLSEETGRFPDQLSGGQQQRVALARALAPAPRLILLDEPFAGLDAGLRERLREEMRRILLDAGTSTILVTHDQEEALSLADQVAVMGGGEVLQVGVPEEIYHSPVCLEVAEFIGEGRLIRCEVEEGRCTSLFGAATCEVEDGPGKLFLRPEDLAMSTQLAGVGVRAKVVDRRFFGHDVLDRVELQDGQALEVRVLSSATVPLGTEVRLSLRERSFRVFPL